MAKTLVVKYSTNMTVVCYISHPTEGLALIAVPIKDGMALVCNNLTTAQDICKNVGLRIHSYHGVRPVITIALKAGTDDGVSALRSCLSKAGYTVVEQGGIPWLQQNRIVR